MKVPVQKCYECPGTMTGRRENYRYLECGLKNVVLRDILVFRCDHCGAVVPEITDASLLHSLIGMRILFRDGRLCGEEVRFLRKLVGYTATALAELAGTSKSVVSRWEHKTTFGENTDRLLRLIFFNKMLVDTFPPCDSDEDDMGLHATRAKTLFDPSKFAHLMENVLRKLRAKAAAKTVTIERAELEQMTAPLAGELLEPKPEYVS